MPRSELLFMPDNRPTDAFATLLSAVGIPGTDLASANEALQKRFFQTDPVTKQPLERWELKKVEVNCPVDHIKEHLAKCGFMNETHPNSKVYTYTAWPGALLPRAKVRLDDIIAVWDNGVRWEQTIVFGGKRPLQPEKEGFVPCCVALGLTQGHPFFTEAERFWQTRNPQSELDMMTFLWAFAFVKYGKRHELQNQPVIFVDAPMKHFAPEENRAPLRPTTEDTITEWLKSKPKPGSVLLSSGAPYGMAMDEAFWMLLESHGFTVETFGHAAPDLPIENLMREVAGAVNRIKRNRLG